MSKMTRREKLARVLSQPGELVTVADAASALSISQTEAAKILWRWTQQGHIERVRRGLYTPIPITAMYQGHTLSDPWILVPELFAPAYVGGWSAAEYWHLTDQMFRSILVYTAQPIRSGKQEIHGIRYILKRRKPEKIFGTRPVWCGIYKVQISDVHQTLVDMLDTPAVGGGIRHSNSCLKSYLRSEEADLPQVLDYAAQLGNGAVFKRLGFLLSSLDVDEKFLEHCRSRLTTGNAKLEPAIPCRRLIKKWNLWIPDTWDEELESDRP